MGITQSGINPQEVLNLLARIQDEYKKDMETTYDYIKMDIRKKMDIAYGGEAADALMKNTTNLMTNCESALNTIITSVATNMTEDLSDAKATDQNLAG